MSDAIIEKFEERIAISVHCGGCSVGKAVQVALAQIRTEYGQAGVDVVAALAKRTIAKGLSDEQRQ